MLLSDEDWCEAKHLVTVLEAFDIATTIMSSQTKVTLSMVRPLIFKIVHNFLENTSADSALVAEIKRTIKKGLQVRFLEKTSTSNGEPSCALLAEM